MTPQTLILVAGLALLLLAAGGGAMLAHSGRTKRREARISAVLSPHQAARPPAPITRPMRDKLLENAWVIRGADLLGISMAHAATYPIRWWIIVIAAMPLSRAATGIASTLVGGWVVYASPIAWLLICRAIFGRFDSQRRDTLFRQFPDALGMITRSISVGVPVTEAIRIVAREAPEPTCAEFRGIADRLAIGTPIDRALSETALRNGVAEYRFFATALALQAQTGGGLREALDTLAEVIRKRVALRARGLALASEARTSAAILAALPFVATGLLFLLNPSYVMILFFEPEGQRILTLAIGMLLAGIFIMRQMIRKALS